MNTNNIHIRAAADVPRQDFREALNAAYVDYFVPIVLDKNAFNALIVRESVELSASAAAVKDDGGVVGVGLLGIRESRGWIGGMGVIPDYRRQGIGRLLMQHLIEQARSWNLDELVLEVITRNTGAHQLYESLGFETQRRLIVLVRGHGNLPDGFSTDSYQFETKPADVLLDHLESFATSQFCWQHDPVGYRQVLEHVNGVVALDAASGEEVGVLLYAGATPQIGVIGLAAKDESVGRALLAHIVETMDGVRMSYINVAEDDPLLSVLMEAGFEENLDQYEMTYQVD